MSLNICLGYPFNEEMFQIIETHSIRSPLLFDQKPELKEIFRLQLLKSLIKMLVAWMSLGFNLSEPYVAWRP